MPLFLPEAMNRSNHQNNNTGSNPIPNNDGIPMTPPQQQPYVPLDDDPRVQFRDDDDGLTEETNHETTATYHSATIQFFGSIAAGFGLVGVFALILLLIAGIVMVFYTSRQTSYRHIC